MISLRRLHIAVCSGHHGTETLNGRDLSN